MTWGNPFGSPVALEIAILHHSVEIADTVGRNRHLEGMEDECYSSEWKSGSE